jgi:drug/metabolite transporter (DMT)-like permease
MPVLLAFGCALVYGIADYCGGRAARSAPSIAVTVVGQLTSLVVALAAVMLIGTAVPGSDQLLWGATAGLASAFALVAFYHALSAGSMTVVAPITAVLSAVLPVVFGLVQGERPAAIGYLGMATAVAAVALVSGVVGTRGTVTRSSTIGFACVAGLGFALIFVALGQTTTESGVWPLVTARVVSVTLLVGVALAMGMGRRHQRSRGFTSLAVVTGILDMAANVLFLLAVRRGLLSIVVVVAALYPVSTVVLAFVLDRERVSRSQTIGMAMGLGALILVSISGAT